MKKNITNLIYIIFIFNCCLAYASTPVSHIKSAVIEVTQGSQIYANGEMQAVVRVLVELREGATWNKNFKLYEFETRKTLDSLGWTVSEVDNGFDHNIVESRNSIEEYNTSEKQYKIKYISTTNNNSNIKMCFEIETEKGEEKSTYSTCDTYGLDKGTAEIFAKRPYTYYASDFIFSQKQVAFSLKSNQLIPDTSVYQEDIKGEIYGLRTATHIPRNISFTLLNKEKVIEIKNIQSDINSQRITANSTKSVVRKYNFQDKSTTSDKYLGYQEAYLYNITGLSPTTGRYSAIFRFINFNMSSTKNYQVENKNFLKAGDGYIVDILDVSYYRTTFMINEDRCWHDTANKKYGCQAYKTDQTSTDTEHKTYPDTTPLNENVFYQFNLQDNFGTKYSLLWNPYPISGSTYLLDKK